VGSSGSVTGLDFDAGRLKVAASLPLASDCVIEWKEGDAGALPFFAGRQSGYGIVVKIKYAFGFETVYAHLNRTRAKVGQRVGREDRVADMGSTGRSTGSHLHYEVGIDKKPVNPIKFIEAAHDVL